MFRQVVAYVFAFFLVVALTAQVSIVKAEEQAAKQKLPNIVLLMADDQGWGDVGYYGNPIPQTPVLDEMSKTGLRLDRFYAAAPVCSPTRGSVMTGRHPNRFGCFSWGHTLRPQEITVAEALKTAGYATGHFGKWHLGSMRQGNPISPGGSGFDTWFSSPNFYDNNPLMSRNGEVVEAPGESSQIAVDAAVDFIRQAQADGKPFLAVVWFGSPHNPHTATDELLKLYPDLPPKQAHYYGEITGIDRAVGHLRDALRDMHLSENTLLWYTSDNGPQGPDNQPGSAGGLKGRKGSLWEGGLRVPTIIEWPARIPQPRTSDFPSGTVDIYPTLLELAGVTMPGQAPLDGQSLVGLIDGQQSERAKPLGFWVFPASGRGMRSRDILAAQAKAGPDAPPTLYDQVSSPPGKDYVSDENLNNPPGDAAWTAGDYKLHRRMQKDGKAKYELYNLAKDPAEEQDLAAQEPQRVEKLKGGLAAWQLSVIKSLRGEDYR